MYALKKLTIEDRENIQKFTQQFLPYSDFNFVSLWSYNTEDDAEFYLDDNCLILKFRNYMTNEPFYSFLAKKDSLKIAEELLERSAKEGLEERLRLVPEDSLNNTNALDFLKIVEDRDNFDYILSIQTAFSLEGKDFEHQRWHIHQFTRNYPSYSINISHCEDMSEREQIKNVFKIWALRKIDKDSEHELKAISRFLDLSQNLKIHNIGIWQDDNLIGFALIEEINEEYALGHFMKADLSFKGIYDLLYFETAKYLDSIGCKYLNYEQDLGIESLREAKLEWRPVGFLKKYVVSEF